MATDPLVVRGRPTDPQIQLGWCGSSLQVLTQRCHDELAFASFPSFPSLWRGSKGMGVGECQDLDPLLKPADLGPGFLDAKNDRGAAKRAPSERQVRDK